MNESNFICPLDWVTPSRALKSLTAAGLRHSEGTYHRECYLQLHKLACWDKDKQRHPRWAEHVCKLVFLCRITGGKSATRHETFGGTFFSIDHLPLRSTEP